MGNAGMQGVAFQGIPLTWNVSISIFVSTNIVFDLLPFSHSRRQQSPSAPNDIVPHRTALHFHFLFEQHGITYFYD